MVIEVKTHEKKHTKMGSKGPEARAKSCEPKNFRHVLARLETQVALGKTLLRQAEAEGWSPETQLSWVRGHSLTPRPGSYRGGTGQVAEAGSGL